MTIGIGKYAKGSSPRMRGSLKESNDGISNTGIIPADAGLTDDRLYMYPSGGDHPRGCGAHSLIDVSTQPI